MSFTQRDSFLCNSSSSSSSSFSHWDDSIISGKGSDSVNLFKGQAIGKVNVSQFQNEKKPLERGKNASKLPVTNSKNGNPSKYQVASNQTSIAVDSECINKKITCRNIKSDFELDDSDDLCPVCVDNCTCQHKDDVIDVLASDVTANLTKSSIQKRTIRTVAGDLGKRGRLMNQEPVNAAEQCKYSLIEMMAGNNMEQQVCSSSNNDSSMEISVRMSSSPMPFTHTNEGQTISSDNKFAIDLNSGMLVSNSHPYSFSFSDGDDLMVGDYDEEEWDSDDEVYLKYDSVEYEYIANDLLENEVISEIASMEDPIECLDILLFGSSEYKEEDCGMRGVLFKLDQIPAQRQLLDDIRSSSQPKPTASLPIPIPIASKSSPFSQDNFCSVEQKNSFSNYTLNPETGTLCSQTFSLKTAGNPKSISEVPVRPQTAVPFCQNEDSFSTTSMQPGFSSDYAVYSCTIPSGSSLSSINIEETYDSCCEEDSCWPFSTSPHDGGNSDTGMLNIEDILDSTLYSNSRQISYKNEFLDRYKHIPITTFRRTRRKSLIHSKQPRVNYKRIIKHGDRMLCESNTVRPELDFLLVSDANNCQLESANH